MITFPLTASPLEIFTAGTKSWQWDGYVWNKYVTNTILISSVVDLQNTLDSLSGYMMKLGRVSTFEPTSMIQKALLGPGLEPSTIPSLSLQRNF